MKISNRKLVENVVLIQQVSQKQLPAKVAYTIAWNTDKIDSVLKVYDKTRKKMLEQFAEKDENGKIKPGENGTAVFRNDTAKSEWFEQMDALLEETAEIEIRKIKLDDLKDTKGNPISFSAAEFRAIDFMLEE